jgi:cytosine/adenosine deaminase-related metal-dependent hydrolase
MIVLEGGHVATVDAAGAEYPSGHVVIDGATIVAVGPGPAPDELRAGAQLLDRTGCLVTPGLVNTHHHLYQWLTRGYGPDSTLFQWLTELYPIWARIDADTVHAAASANLGWLALSGCSTSTDHHYVFPKAGGDLLDHQRRAGDRGAVPPVPGLDGPRRLRRRAAAG